MNNVSKPDVARVTVNLPRKVWDAVEEMAAETGRNRTEILRLCISTEYARRGWEKEGARLVLEFPNGIRERVSFPS